MEKEKNALKGEKGNFGGIGEKSFARDWGGNPG